MMGGHGGGLHSELPHLTVQDVSQSLGHEKFLQTCDFILQLTHQLGIGVFVDHSIALDLLGSVSVSVRV